MAEDDDKADKDDVTEEELDEAIEGEEASGKKKGKKKLLIIIVALILLGGAGAGVYFSGILGGMGGGGDDESAAEEALKKATEKHYYALPEYLVNLNTSSRQSSFLKMVIILELISPEDEKIIEANLPRVNDSFNTYLRELRPSDLYGSAGLYRLREELLDRINKIIAPAAVNDILFKQVLIQ